MARSDTLKPRDRDRPIIAWLATCCLLVVVMVLLGGLTRLTDSGLSITEWRPVTGTIPPLSGEAWEAEFAKYRAIPEYQEINRGMSLDEFKAIYWWEYTHRLWGRMIGLVFAVPFAWFWYRGRLARDQTIKLAVIFALGGAQGALGWFMVASGLVDRVDVSQYRLAAHLALAVIIYAGLLWVLLDAWQGRAAGEADPRLAAMAGAVVVMIFLTMIAGAFVAGLDAGLSYNTFPLMEGRWVPSSYGALSPWWRNLFENHAAVQFNHRVLGLSSFAACIAFWLHCRRLRPGSPARRRIDAVAILATIQASLGIATLLLAVPIALGALHQLGALALLSAGLAAWHGLLGPARLTSRAPARPATG